MNLKQSVRAAARISKSNFAATCIAPLMAVSMMSTLASATTPGIILWNKLGSDSEVLNSAYGPNLSFYQDYNGIDVPANPDYVPGVFGGALTIGPGNYGGLQREHNAIWSGLDQSLNSEQGTISMWYKQNSDPVGFDHGVYRLFDGAYGLDSGMGLWSQAAFPNPGPPTLEFALSFSGVNVELSTEISQYNGTWIHVAGVWDRNGIGNTTDTMRLYINGSVIASTTEADWGTTIGQNADIAGGNDGNIADQFAIDNLKVYNVAVTDFSDRFTEGIPEPTTGCLAAAAMLFAVATARKRS